MFVAGVPRSHWLLCANYERFCKLKVVVLVVLSAGIVDGE